MKKLLILLLILSLLIPATLAADKIEIPPTMATLSEATTHWKVIDHNGQKSDITKDNIKKNKELSVLEFSTPSKIKSLQSFPESTIQVSADMETVMQQTEAVGFPKVELYYGYQTAYGKPWQYFYQIQSCDNIRCRVVRGEFETRKIWIEEISLNNGLALAASSSIPAYNDLPVGVIV